MRRCSIGTSGWNYPHWKDIFYPPGLPASRWLDWYASCFDTVEINIAFYHLVRRETFEGWRERTPEDFAFVVKGSRFITHQKRLRAADKPLDVFLRTIDGLQEKLRALLWQLPPSFKKDLGRLETFLELLRRKSGARQVFELRHESWFTQEVYDLLKSYNACLCVAHSDRLPCVRVRTADFLYLRFHGGKAYRSSYCRMQLEKWAGFARSSRGDVLVYFNNDAEGFAIQNALALKEMLEPVPV